MPTYPPEFRNYPLNLKEPKLDLFLATGCSPLVNGTLYRTRTCLTCVLWGFFYIIVVAVVSAAAVVVVAVVSAAAAAIVVAAAAIVVAAATAAAAVCG